MMFLNLKLMPEWQIYFLHRQVHVRELESNEEYSLYYHKGFKFRRKNIIKAFKILEREYEKHRRKYELGEALQRRSDALYAKHKAEQSAEEGN